MNNTPQKSQGVKNYALALYRIALTLFIAALLVSLPFVVKSPSDALLAFLAISALVMVSVPVFLWKDFDIFEPLSFLVFLTSWGIAFKIIYILGFRDRHYVILRLLLGENPDALIYGMFAVFVGLFFFLLGYWRRSGRLPIDFLFVPRYQNWDAARMRIVCIGILVIAGAAFLIFSASVGVNFSSLDSLSGKRFIDMSDASRNFREERIQSGAYYFYRIAAFAKFVMYLSLAWMIKKNHKWLSLDAVLVAWAALQTVALFVVMQSRAGIALVMFDCVIISYYLLKHLPIKKIVVGGAIVGVLMVVQLSIRVRSENYTLLDLIEKTVAGRDIMDISKTSHIINAVPERLEYRYGETLVGWLAAPIPMSVWPDKPLWSEKGVHVFQRVFGGRDTSTGMTIGLIAELYWNLGWLGICCGCFLFGAFLRNFYATFLAHKNNIAAVIIYALFVTRFTVFTLGGDLGTGVLKASLDLIPLAVIYVTISMIPGRNPLQQNTSSMGIRST